MIENRAILIVEDDAATLEMVSMALQDELGPHGFTIASAADGREALTVAPVLQPEVILLDLTLRSSIDGLEVSRQLRRNPITRRVKIIAVSGHDWTSDALGEGCDDYLHKPFDLQQLFDVVRRWLPRDGLRPEPADSSER
jgi:CheY-like chemotaxis protein